MKLILSCLIALAFGGVARAAETSAKTQANVMAELSFDAKNAHADPFNEVTLDVVFTDPAGHAMKVPGFWDGKNLWKVRYASAGVGKHTFRTECSDANDAGLNGVTGSVEIEAYTGTNPLYQHGPMRVADDKRHLIYADGTPFFWLGDTWWMGLCHRLHFPDEVHTLATDRKEKGFTVIQIVAGLYPDMFPFDPRGANEAGFPWEKDYKAIRPEYFDEADKRFKYLVDEGFTPCIVGAWGYFMQWMGEKKMEQHWRNLIARYGAMPVAWCAAGEGNLPWYLAKGFPYDDRKQVTDWTAVMKYIRETDPYHRPLTVHPTGIGRLSARHAVDDSNLLDIDMLQTPHGQRDAVAPTVNTMRQSYNDSPVMPVIDGEAAYEMLSDNLPTQWTRRMFWLCMMNGAAGHTYGANGIWQCNRKGQPHGPSPHHAPGSVGYGIIPWDDAMNLPGSGQEGMGKKFLEQFDWQKFVPHPEWAAYSDKPSLKFDGGNWIWFPEGDPTKDAPATKRYFRRVVELPEGKKIVTAQLRLAVDDRFAAMVNGQPAGTSAAGAESWKTGGQFDIAKFLTPGKNVIAIEAENLPAPSANPAGLIAKLDVKLDDGSTIALNSDAQWQSSKEAAADWQTVAFDDSTWTKAAEIAKYGGGPWGAIPPMESDPVYGPQSTGIDGVVRVIYAPDALAISLHTLAKGASYDASWFDPVTGASTALNAIQADDSGAATCAPPEKIDHDWVLVLRDKH